MMLKRRKLPKRMRIGGVGLVEVTRLPKSMPHTVRIGNVDFPVDKENFRAVWAMQHMTKAERKRRAKMPLY